MKLTAFKIAVAFVFALTAGPQYSRAQSWVLPEADDSTQASAPSVQGYVVSVGKKSISISRDSRSGKEKHRNVTVQLTPKSEYFTAYGGLYTPDELSPGQYIWVWYVTRDPKKAGVPPRAAVVMLWSKDPSDKPSREIRFDKHN